MKKFFAMLAVSLIAFTASAQYGIFNHVALGVGVGTTGISAELATPLTKFFQVRAGISYMPSIKFNTDADFELDGPYGYTEGGSVDLQGDFGRTQAQVILNFYPIPSAGFYIAGGAYFNGDKLLKITGHSDEIRDAIARGEEANVTIGDYTLPVNNNGDVRGGFRLKKVRPYLGIGFGRVVPRKFFSFTTEFGVQFQGKPELYSEYGDISDVNKELEDDDTFKKIQDVLKVYPTITFRLNFRAF